MDAIDILGSLLGGSRSSSGGGSVLKDLINAGGRRSQKPTTPSRTGGGDSRPASPEDRARELEDLLGVAKERSGGHSPAAPAPPASNTPSRYRPPPPTRPQPPTQADRGGFTAPADSRSGTGFGNDRQAHSTSSMTQNDEALVLVRAMINAAKSDGSISQAEQRAIIDRISSPTQETINFLREEFSKPLDVREFTWSVPLGMEQQVYTLSLAAIELDSNSESGYLRDLAHGLRLTPEFCNELHRRYGAPTIF